jgi:hypothetical protein
MKNSFFAYFKKIILLKIILFKMKNSFSAYFKKNKPIEIFTELHIQANLEVCRDQLKKNLEFMV